MGAAGRDFHNFNMLFRDDRGSEVVAFTAAQIPFIHDRSYPPELSGPLYPNGIPIYPEKDLSTIIKAEKIDTVVFSYSDVSNDYIMERASLCASLGADFVLPGYEKAMLRSKRPVITVCAVRTGCGKSGVSRYVCKAVTQAGKKAVAIRHPMPYGDLARQSVQRFSTYADMKAAKCTIEEMEEYEPLIEAGITVYAGVDYARILEAAEQEAEVIVWDGGNNDPPFLKPSLALVVTDPFRAGNELTYYHGAVNVRLADIAIINKTNSAEAGSIEKVEKNVRSLNANAKIIRMKSVVEADAPIEGKKVLIIEDGPTLTHGGMGFGAGFTAAKLAGATPVDPRPYAAGTIKDVFKEYAHIEKVLPAMGYSAGQRADLEKTINSTPCDAVLISTPVDLSKILKINRPVVRVRYEVKEAELPGLSGAVEEFLKGMA